MTTLHRQPPPPPTGDPELMVQLMGWLLCGVVAAAVAAVIVCAAVLAHRAITGRSTDIAVRRLVGALSGAVVLAAAGGTFVLVGAS